MKVLELFAGIGACSKALTNLGIEHEIVDAVEIDKYAIKSFNAIHGTDFEPQDITKWDKDIECDLIMHGSPCQDFSVAGKNAGGDKDSGTRSSLMYETLRIVEKLRPKYVIWENVKNLLSKKHRHNFDAYLEAMEKLGYTNFYQVLNAKGYGIPQNRERVFTVSIREDIWDKTYDSFGKIFEFPEPFALEKRLKDVLDEDVDEKFYLSDKQTERLILARKKPSDRPLRLGWLYDKDEKQHQAGSIYSPDGIAAALSTMQGGNQEPLIVASLGRNPENDDYVAIKTANKKGYDIAAEGDGVDLAYPDSKTRRGRVGHGVSKTLATSDTQGVVESNRIRKLTPKECWRLMGFDDSDFEKVEKVNSNSQLYKQAGNSIVVNVLEKILFNLLEGE